VCADDVDAVVVATPATTHYEIVLAALEAGKHVLCEKPLTMSVADCEHLISVADAAGVTLFVGHTFVYNAAVRAMRELAAVEELGPTVHAHAVWAAPGPVRSDVNALWDLAPHPISILLYVLRRLPRAVSASGQAILDPEREDITFMRLFYDETLSADVELSWLAPRKVRSLTLTGARRIAIFDDTAPAEKLGIFDTASLGTNGYQGVGPAKRKTMLPPIPVHVPQIPDVEPLRAQLDHFLECCRRGLTPESDGMAGTNVVSVLEAANTSLREGGRVVDLEDLVLVRCSPSSISERSTRRCRTSSSLHCSAPPPTRRTSSARKSRASRTTSRPTSVYGTASASTPARRRSSSGSRRSASVPATRSSHPRTRSSRPCCQR
jgi:predicted dehydrogenase